jgi:hypothetical protein
MRFLANENFPRDAVAALAASGHRLALGLMLELAELALKICRRRLDHGSLERRR